MARGKKKVSRYKVIYNSICVRKPASLWQARSRKRRKPWNIAFNKSGIVKLSVAGEIFDVVGSWSFTPGDAKLITNDY